MNLLEWDASTGPVEYRGAISRMEDRVAAILAGDAPELIWLLEHPPLYTGGTSAQPEDLIGSSVIPVFPTGRGGQYTYHGPGQRIAYTMLDLRVRGRDVRKYVRNLEQWLIDVLAGFGIDSKREDGRVGVWVNHPNRGIAKIGAIGVRVRRWITYHGISLNVDPDLSHYASIVPCGISDAAVTSLADLGVDVTLEEVDLALRHCFENIFEADLHTDDFSLGANIAASAQSAE